MHGNRREIILPCQNKGQLAICHQGELLAFGIMHRIKMVASLGAGLHILWQVLNSNRFDVNDAWAGIAKARRINWSVHLFQPFLILIV